MIRVATKRRLALRIRAKKLWERQLAWKRWKKAKRRGETVRKVLVFQEGKVTQAWAGHARPMPSEFCLDTNYSATVAFLNRLRRELLETAETSPIERLARRKTPRRLRSFVDFASIRTITPSAALVLAAEYDRWRKLVGTKLQTINEHEWNAHVQGMLRAIGFHELLEMSPKQPRMNLGDLRVLRFLSGEQAVGESVGKLQEALAELLPEDAAQQLLYVEPYAGMFEAILNSWNWAYPTDHPWEHPFVRMWWMTGSVDVRRNEVNVAVFDQGVSIPVSLPHWKHFERLERVMLRAKKSLGLEQPFGHPSYDGAAIKMAMKVAKTATGLSQHGKGLHTMQEVAERASHGRLRVVSRNGEYIWETGRSPISRYNEAPLHGTLVEWWLAL